MDMDMDMAQHIQMQARSTLHTNINPTQDRSQDTRDTRDTKILMLRKRHAAETTRRGLTLVANPSWDLFVGHGRGVSDSPSHLGRCP